MLFVIFFGLQDPIPSAVIISCDRYASSPDPMIKPPGIEYEFSVVKINTGNPRPLP